MGKTKTKTVSESLRNAIQASQGSLYRLAKDSGIGYASLHGFMNGDRTLSLEVVDKLCQVLGLVLQEGKK
jgi:hypothetical protein